MELHRTDFFVEFHPFCASLCTDLFADLNTRADATDVNQKFVQKLAILVSQPLMLLVQYYYL